LRQLLLLLHPLLLLLLLLLHPLLLLHVHDSLFISHFVFV